MDFSQITRSWLKCRARRKFGSMHAVIPLGRGDRQSGEGTVTLIIIAE